MVTGLSKLKTAEVEIDLQLFMQKNLARAIDKKMNSKLCSKSGTTKDVMGIVKRKLAIFEVEGKRGANLQHHQAARNQNVFFLDVEELLLK
jgi:hypothetical protein